MLHFVEFSYSCPMTPIIFKVYQANVGKVQLRIMVLSISKQLNLAFLCIKLLVNARGMELVLNIRHQHQGKVVTQVKQNQVIQCCPQCAVILISQRSIPTA